MEHQVARLSEGQRECLRMVYRHMETKEIARILGISPDGVTQRIKVAMRILGVQRRRDAALLLAQYEGAEPYPSLVYPPRDIAFVPNPQTFAPTTEGGRPSGSSGEAMREEQIAFKAITLARGPALPLPIGGARPNDVGILKRLAWIAGITIGIALAFGALISGVEALTRLIWS
ncbi:MAG TPA: helix-turn-helix transcriptional regulator [Allosphingosinicella sp.]|nr:helix-turn-helix transcriptional regulator [Allosphingosinicella sp.]